MIARHFKKHALAAVLITTGLLLLPHASAQASETNVKAAQEPGTARLQKRSAVADSGGLAVHYEVYGDLATGQIPILILHGAYMSADSMAPFVERFARSRPVIVVDQRGHGRTGDAPGPITYELLADDAAAVLDAAGIEKADVFGYSMGGAAAFQLGARHPGKVAKLVSVSAYARLDAMYPEVLAGIAGITPAIFDGSPIRREYDRLSPRPEDFPILVEELKVLDATPFDWAPAMRALPHRTMIVMGDHDTTTPEHAVEMFRLRDGAVPATAAQGFLTSSPPARLLILPATSHIGIMTQAEVIVSLVLPFLEDVTPPMPEGFL